MQIAAFYDSGQIGQGVIKKLADDFGEPYNNDTKEGAVLWTDLSMDAGLKLLTALYEGIEDRVIFSVFAGDQDQDMSQFLPL